MDWHRLALGVAAECAPFSPGTTPHGADGGSAGFSTPRLLGSTDPLAIARVTSVELVSDRLQPSEVMPQELAADIILTRAGDGATGRSEFSFSIGSATLRFAEPSSVGRSGDEGRGLSTIALRRASTDETSTNRCSTVTGIDHVALVVREGTAASLAELLCRLLAAEVSICLISSGSREVAKLMQIRPPVSGTAIVLVEPLSDSAAQLHRFLQDNGGPGIQHMAFATTNIAEFGERLLGVSTPLIQPPPGHYADLSERELSPSEIERMKKANVFYDDNSGNPIRQCFTKNLFGSAFFYEGIQPPPRPNQLGVRNVNNLFAAVDEAL